jgi:hypothetical protein
VTYPNREDFESYEAFDRARTAAREDAARADLDRTGICTRRILPTDQVRVSCSVCLHAEALHPGFTNPDPDLTGCVVCHLKVLAAGPTARGSDRELPPRADPTDRPEPRLTRRLG